MDKFVGPIVFLSIIAFFFIVSFLIYFISGWRSLVRDFPDSEENNLSGDSYFFQTLLLSFFSGFRNAMNITVKRNGLEMRPVFPLSITLPRVFIPWDDVKEVNSKTGSGTHEVEIVLSNRKLSIRGNSAKVIRKR